MHSLEYLSDSHKKILNAAALEGVDIEPSIQGATRLIGYGDTKHGYGPACIIDITQTEHVAEPHVIWFPWTTAKNRIVNFKWAMNLISESHHILLNVEKKHKEFFEHFAKKGFLRKIGYIEALPIVEEIHMYQIQRRTA